MDYLENPKVRIGIFALVVVFLFTVVFWASSTLGEETSPTSSASIAAPADRPGEPGLEGTVADEPVEKPEALDPGELPAPDPIPDSTIVPSPPAVSEKDVVRFLKFYNTYSAPDLFDNYSKEAVRLGAVLSSPATLAPLSSREQQDCKAASCSSEFINATDVTIHKDGTAAALVEVRVTTNTSSYNMLIMCSLKLATGNEPNPGLFTDVSCYYGGGD